VAVIANESDLQKARNLVLRYGWNTTCYQVVNPGIERWFSRDGDAMVGYVAKKGRRVVAGAPICTLDRLPEVIKEWRSANPALPACYFGAEERVHEALGKNPEYSTVVLGAQPVWSPANWAKAIDGDASLRYQLQRARRKEIEVSEWAADRVTGNLDLQRVLHEWLQTRGLPPMHFLVEPETLDCLDDRRLFVAERKGRPVGFVTMSPVPTRSGWLTEQFVRGKEAPNGTIELMLDTAIRTVGKEGALMVTMGIVPLSARGHEESLNPRWLKILTAWMRAHGRRFYNFDGLDAFKSKFHPDYWEPIYVISREKQFSLRTLYAVAAAFTSENPVIAVVKGIFRAAQQELRWLARRRTPQAHRHERSSERTTNSRNNRAQLRL
jgi:lysylphosphatidylglycerol synthetase-like protein (DUF2156 family)